MGVETERLEKGLDAEEESYAGHGPIDVDSIEKRATQYSYKTNSSPGRRRWVQEWKVSEAYMKYRQNGITISFSLLGAACPVRKLGSQSLSTLRKPRLRRRLLRILFFHRASLRGGMNEGN